MFTEKELKWLELKRKLGNFSTLRFDHITSVRDSANFESAVTEHILNNYKKYCDMDFSDSKYSKEWHMLKNARIEVEEMMN